VGYTLKPEQLLTHGALLLALFILVFVACSGLLEVALLTAERRFRLRRVQLPGTRRPGASRQVPGWLSRHLQDLLEALNIRARPESFLLLSAVGCLIGLGAGGYLFLHIRGMLMLGVMLAALPYIVLRMRLVSKQMAARLEFLPAVEVFYQYYVMTDPRNIRQALAMCLEERRMRMPIRAPFERLFRHLSTNRSVDDALRVFAFSLGHVWGVYLTNLLRVGLTEGVDISASLQELILDMRQSQTADQAARNRLLEIRIANFSPPVFFVLFILVNFRLNGQQAIYYYLVDPGGKHMLLNGVILMFASFVMGLWLSIRRM
jgi:Flp pilus assembly protein TadB